MHDDDDGLAEFLVEIIRGGRLESGSPAEGIAKQVIDRGRESLSEKQEYVFKRHVIDEYVTSECTRCANPVPWCEMMLAYENDGYCGYCLHMSEKMEDE